MIWKSSLQFKHGNKSHLYVNLIPSALCRYQQVHRLSIPCSSTFQTVIKTVSLATESCNWDRWQIQIHYHQMKSKTCLILKKHDYKWGTVGGNNKEPSRSHWHIQIVANLFANWIDKGEVSNLGWQMECVKCTMWHDSLYFLCLLVVPICRILAVFQCTWWPSSQVSWASLY
jgi:hypothetical protein